MIEPAYNAALGPGLAEVKWLGLPISRSSGMGHATCDAKGRQRTPPASDELGESNT